jgi:hypothetical protein
VEEEGKEGGEGREEAWGVAGKVVVRVSGGKVREVEGEEGGQEGGWEEGEGVGEEIEGMAVREQAEGEIRTPLVREATIRGSSSGWKGILSRHWDGRVRTSKGQGQGGENLLEMELCDGKCPGRKRVAVADIQ